MSTKVILLDADFSNNCIPADGRWLLHSNDVEVGLIENADGGVLRPDPTPIQASRVTTKNFIYFSQYDQVTIPAGVQVCANFFTESGTYVSGNATWYKNEGTEPITIYMTDLVNFQAGRNAVKYKMSIGWVDSTTSSIHNLAPSELDTLIKVYMLPSAIPEVHTFTSAEAEEGFLDYATGTVTQNFPKRCSLPQVYRLADYDQIYIPEGLQFFVVYSNGGQYYGSDAYQSKWNTTTDWQNITSAINMIYANCPNATEFQLCLGKVSGDKLYASEIGTTYTVQIRNSLNP